ncbi:unnamed protein product, partial [marine sediment metagenome]
VIPRLIDMKIDPYLIPSTLILAIAQRLVRRLCPESKKQIKPSTEIEELIKKELPNAKAPHTLYEPQISEKCPKGTKGRIAIFEVLEMTSQLEDIILKEPSETKIKEEAKRQGMITMLQDGISKVLKGIVGVEEVRKAVEE